MTSRAEYLALALAAHDLPPLARVRVGLCVCGSSRCSNRKDLMQTFLPYADFQKSAKCLDNRRLGKQRVEGYQILRTLLGISDGWRNHPATKMWAGHTKLLRRYTQVCINEWIARGYKNTIILPEPNDNRLQLWWLGDERLHASHRSNLLRKDPDWYGRFGWSDDPAAPYWWPSQQET